MKNILLVFTGGTIGSSIIEHTINTDSSNQFTLLNLYRQQYSLAAQVHFHVITPVEILSENLIPSIWETITAAIDAVDYHDFDGIIVTHGTDTLAYTACALGFNYAHIQNPLVLVSSNYPLSDTRANGVDNFNTALEFILQRHEAGVFVAYRNQGQKSRIHLGSRLISCLPLSDQFMSIRSKTYLEFDGTEFTVINQDSAPSFSGQTALPRPVRYSNRIVMIKPYPGLDYTHFDLHNVGAVLHDLYHSGTACATDAGGGNYSLVNFIERCQHHDISVYLAPAWYSAEAYASTKALQASGASMIWNTSLEAAFVKLLLAYGNFEDVIRRQDFLDQNFANEQLDFVLK